MVTSAPPSGAPTPGTASHAAIFDIIAASPLALAAATALVKSTPLWSRRSGPCSLTM